MTNQTSKPQEFTQILQQLAEPELQRGVVHRLSNLLADELTSFAQTWPRFSIERRREIISQMVEISEADIEVDFTPVFILGSKDPDPQVRALSIEGLWENEDHTLVRPLIRLLHNDPSAIVRETAAVSLGRFALLAELEKLQPHFADLIWDALWHTIHAPKEELDVCRRAVESIAYFGRQETLDIIEQAYNHEEPRMRASAVFAMGRSADDRWENIVLDELDSDDSEMRYEAVRACGALQLDSSVMPLSKLVVDPDSEVKQMAAWALGQIGSPEARRVLEICCEQGDEALQEAAEEALAQVDLLQGSLDFSMYDFGSMQDTADDVDQDH
jgi:HEAT repeat protein